MDRDSVIVVSHGKIFSTKNWYTFYCPYCGRQLSYRSNNDRCEYCDKRIQWGDD
jgi:predicted RNA-binding Zn-ribbon protein involved in translation (DUF1610 family)